MVGGLLVGPTVTLSALDFTLVSRAKPICTT
jgi:hypothetical protein